MRKLRILRSSLLVALALAALVILSCAPAKESSYMIGAEAGLESGSFTAVATAIEEGAYWTSGDATITVNDQVLEYNGLYNSNYMLTPVAADDPVTFHIAIDGLVVDRTLDMPGTVLITAPTAGTYLTDSPLTVSWNGWAGSVTAPEYVQVYVSALDTLTEEPYQVVVPYSDLQHVIPANTLAADPTFGVTIYVDGYYNSPLTGDRISSGSYVRVMNRLSVDILTEGP